MAHAAYNLTVEPTGVFYGDGSAKVRHKAYGITADAQATVVAANYFNASVTRLPKGTTIDMVTDADGTPKNIKLIVTANSGTVVTVALQTVA